jgi:hypothetical protein
MTALNHKDVDLGITSSYLAAVYEKRTVGGGGG